MVVSTAWQKVERELAIMKKMSHPSIVRFLEAIDDETNGKFFMGALPVPQPRSGRCVPTAAPQCSSMCPAGR